MAKAKRSTHLVVGYGEVGKGLHKVLMKKYLVDIVDIGKTAIDMEYDCMHICFPYNPNFDMQVWNYMARYRPKLVIIHSSVPIGTTRHLGNNVVHSPIRGRHPFLAEGIQKFTKYFGSVTKKKSLEAAKYFSDLGMNCVIAKNPETTELAKIMCTTDLGYQVIFEKEVMRLCKKYKADFKTAYTDFRKTYNQGYGELDCWHFTKPILDHKKGGIGGHCVMSNIEFLKSPLTKWIRKQNRKLRKV